MKKNILILFGGISPEHEVSVITGLQIVENIDREKFNPYIVYVTPQGELRYYGDIKSKKEFKYDRKTDEQNGTLCTLINKKGKGFITFNKGFKKDVPIDIAYLAFHGGNGEDGEIQGLLYSMCIPMTSCFWEGAVIAQNKVLTKEVLSNYDMPVIHGKGLLSRDILSDYKKVSENILDDKAFKLPLIIKPAHLGSSIGIKVAHDRVEFEKALLQVANLDTEVLVEDFITDFTEYNCSVRTVNNEVQASVIERPLSKDEILSFADKYQRGSKSKTSGMASLDREIPAKISKELEEKIQSLSKKIYIICRCKGVVRIDFMVTRDGKIYLTEVNSIPGSMSFYIWEASGISFKQQISESLDQAELDYKERKEKEIVYESDIVEKFINS